MNWILWIAVSIIGGFFVTLWAFVATMHLMHIMKRDGVSLFWKVPLFPLSLVGLLLDWLLFNWVFGTLLFRELPRELLFSSRIQRHVRESGGSRLRIALFWKRILNQIDERHIR